MTKITKEELKEELLQLVSRYDSLSEKYMLLEEENRLLKEYVEKILDDYEYYIDTMVKHLKELKKTKPIN